MIGKNVLIILFNIIIFCNIFNQSLWSTPLKTMARPVVRNDEDERVAMQKMQARAEKDLMGT